MTEQSLQRMADPARHLGFTGTQRGMTPEQWARVADLLGVHCGWLHHGDCIGADRQVHDLARARGIRVAIHPPKNRSKRAYCRDYEYIFPPEEYLERNKAIVNAAVALLATPAGFDEELRSGTWSTIRYARRVCKPRVIVFPDGSVRNER